MNKLHSIECPQCRENFKSVKKAEHHIVSKHCKFCGRQRPIQGSELKPIDVLDAPEYNSVIKKVTRKYFVGSTPPDLRDIQGGFTSVLLQELIQNADEYVESSGQLTNREFLEYHELHRSRTKGKICSDCLDEYEQIVEETN